MDTESSFDEVADLVSDKTGWLVKSLSLKVDIK